ncbi:hypothetical protein [Chryseobacterium sp. SC28]|uniref:hypothetical protein n=1 Tax=Chryseobacterium sp. SC28 TaxID=2268028 RepID=UPI000F64BD8B|nr:hypothetical protein [Chryseobacterium sp. SC28]RRQ47273.1 hypothetical protein DTW91_00890 [Chryseobacterium sp. SC28]
MERKIIFAPQVTSYLVDLINILFEKEYFGFPKSAEEYVNNIRNFIEEKLGIYPPKSTPKEWLKFGENYLRYEANAKTSWYIFYSQIGQTYFVKFITNSHSGFLSEFNIY